MREAIPSAVEGRRIGCAGQASRRAERFIMWERSEDAPPVDLDAAAAFHGHLGPYLVLGLRMGARIVRALKKRHFGLRVTVHCPPQPPPSCVADGLQLSTGCSLGKRNITLEPADEIVVIAERNEAAEALASPSRIVLQGRQSTIQRAQELMAAESDVASAQWLMSRPDDELFDVIEQV